MSTASTLKVMDIGLRSYESALSIQESLVEDRKKNAISDVLLFVIHEPVYTLGRNADESNMIASDTFRARHNIKVVRTSRGGEVTYHGPGQLVVYPIIHLGQRGKLALWYISALEETIIRTLFHFNITGNTDRKNRGVWVGNDKIAAIGVRITGHVTMHGLSLNVHADLTPYEGIISCGIKDKGHTSMHLLTADVSMASVKHRLIVEFKRVLEEEDP